MRALLFDFNGVLVDDEPVHCATMQRTLADEGIELSDADYESLCLGRDDLGALVAVLTAAGEPAPPDRLSRLVARKSAYYSMRIRADGFRFVDGAREIVVSAHEAGRMLGVVTGALRSEVEQALHQMDLADRFKIVVAAEDVERGKPDPEPYRHAMRELNALPPLPERLLHPHEVLAIEDSEAGLRSAAAAGCLSLGITTSFDSDRLSPLADRVVPTLVGLDMRALERLFAA
ncbi:MAG: HAD family phosphatase [Acidobacteriota bacterium]